MGVAEGYLPDLCGCKCFGYQASRCFDDIGYALELSFYTCMRNDLDILWR